MQSESVSMYLYVYTSVFISIVKSSKVSTSLWAVRFIRKTCTPDHFCTYVISQSCGRISIHTFNLNLMSCHASGIQWGLKACEPFRTIYISTSICLKTSFTSPKGRRREPNQMRQNIVLWSFIWYNNDSVKYVCSAVSFSNTREWACHTNQCCSWFRWWWTFEHKH